MSAVVTDVPGGGPAGDATAAGGARSPVRPRRRVSWRWLRWAWPFLLVIVLVLVTAIVRGIDSPDYGDPDTLSPTAASRFGGKALADMLAERGMTVDRVTGGAAAIDEARTGDATVFVPAPAFVDPTYLQAMALLPRTVRVVLVEPSQVTLDETGVGARVAGRRGETAVVAPGCELPEATAAGPAGVARTRYAFSGPGATSCYGGGVLTEHPGRIELMLVGADDPFRNDRIGEDGNAALAIGLLSAHSRVVWLDLHTIEPPPRYDQPTSTWTPPRTYSPEPRPTDDPNSRRTGPPDDSGSGGGGSGSGSGSGGSSEPPNPLWTAFPAWVWPAVVLIVLAGLVTGLWRGRRIGPPVPEPLPVAVRGAETVEGRGRLYQRARASSVAIAALRSSALGRLAPALGLAADAPPPEVVAAVAARTGRSPDQVRALLFTYQPADDADLVRLVDALDALVRDATSEGRPRPDPGNAAPAGDVGPERE